MTRIRLIMGWILIAIGLVNALSIVAGLLLKESLFDLSVSVYMTVLCLAFGIPLVYMEMKKKK